MTDVLCSLKFGGPCSSQMRSSSLSVVLCHVIIGKFANSLRWREIWAGRMQSEVLYLRVLWLVQVFPDAFRSLQFSGFCFSFVTQVGEKQQRKKKEKLKKTGSRLTGLSDPDANCSQLANRQACPAVMCFKKLI